MPTCTHCHQPQTAAQVICSECYRALTERTVSMDDKLIEALRSAVDKNRFGNYPTIQVSVESAYMIIAALEEHRAQLAEKDKQLAAAEKCIANVETYLNLGSAKYIKRTIELWRGPQDAGGGRRMICHDYATVVVCDRCSFEFQVERKLGEKAMRKIAKGDGWKVDKDGKDICPFCIKRELEATP